MDRFRRGFSILVVLSCLLLLIAGCAKPAVADKANVSGAFPQVMMSDTGFVVHKDLSWGETLEAVREKIPGKELLDIQNDAYQPERLYQASNGKMVIWAPGEARFDGIKGVFSRIEYDFWPKYFEKEDTLCMGGYQAVYAKDDLAKGEHKADLIALLEAVYEYFPESNKVSVDYVQTVRDMPLEEMTQAGSQVFVVWQAEDGTFLNVAGSAGSNDGYMITVVAGQTEAMEALWP